jgi:hypothetical protein
MIKEKFMADNIAQKFAGLPLGLLVCSPIIEVAKGQAELCRVYLEYIHRLAYADEGKGEKKQVNTIDFDLERPVTDGEGNIDKQKIKVSAPVLSLVPVPAFTMQEATVAFTMEVKEQVTDMSSKESHAEMKGSFSFWRFHASISGSVTNKSEHTRSTDNSAKYDITAKAIQQPPAEGMAKLTSLFASIIEPIAVGSAK